MELKSSRSVFKSERYLRESKLLNDLTERLEFFHDMDTNVKIISFSMFSLGLFPSLCIPL